MEHYQINNGYMAVHEADNVKMGQIFRGVFGKKRSVKGIHVNLYNVADKKNRLNEDDLKAFYKKGGNNTGYSLDNLFAINGMIPVKEARKICMNIVRTSVYDGPDRTDLRYKKYFEPEYKDQRTDDEKYNDFLYDLSFFVKDLPRDEIEFLRPRLKRIYSNRIVTTMLSRYVRLAPMYRITSEDYFIRDKHVEKSLYETYALYLHKMLLEDTGWMGEDGEVDV